jgi:hypothetical protein
MGHTRDELTQHVAERWWGQVTRRDHARVARRLDRQPVVDGVYRRDEGAGLDDFCHCLRAIGVMTLLGEAHGTAIQREMVPVVPSILRDGLQTWFGIERINAWPTLLFSDEALMRLVGFNAPQVRQGICQRGASQRQVARGPGPMCPDTLAKHLVQWHVRDLAGVCNGAIRALAQAGVVAKQVTGMADGTDLETTARYRGCG